VIAITRIRDRSPFAHRANLSNYFDGEIAFEMRQKVEKHLRGAVAAQRFATPARRS
jgi:hypothetical protein